VLVLLRHSYICDSPAERMLANRGEEGGKEVWPFIAAVFRVHGVVMFRCSVISAICERGLLLGCEDTA
jgi:hypothetical protein